MKVSVNNKEFDIAFADEKWKINGQPTGEIPGISNRSVVTIKKNGQTYSVTILYKMGKEYKVDINGSVYDLRIKDDLDLLLEAIGIDANSSANIGGIHAPMPGLILDVLVEKGASIKKGDSIMVLEAMKMENIIKSPTDGIISEIAVQKGDSVEKNKELCRFEN